MCNIYVRIYVLCLYVEFCPLIILLVDCSSISNSSMKILERVIEEKNVFIQEQMRVLLFFSLGTRQEQQYKFLTETQERVGVGRKNEGVLNIRNQHHLCDNLPFIYGVTPTYKRFTQKADLTRLCQTVLHVPNFHWIIVEDSESKTDLVEKFLVRCKVKYTHLAVKTSPAFVRGKNEPRWKKPRGVEQRNAALNWLRHNTDVKEAGGVLYFMDDDNTYDLEIFEQVSDISTGEFLVNICSFNFTAEEDTVNHVRHSSAISILGLS